MIARLMTSNAFGVNLQDARIDDRKSNVGTTSCFERANGRFKFVPGVHQFYAYIVNLHTH